MKYAPAIRVYPSYGFEPIPHPAHEPAINQPGLKYALLRRAVRHLRRLAIGGITLAAAVTVAVSVRLDGTGVFADVVAAMAGSGVLAAGGAGLVWTGYLWRHLSRSQWTVLRDARTPMVPDRPATRMYAEGCDAAGEPVLFEFRVRRSRRTGRFGAGGRGELWFAGDPGRGGVLTPAGGGDMCYARGRIIGSLPDRSFRFGPIPWSPEITEDNRYATALRSARAAGLPRPPYAYRQRPFGKRPVKRRK
jgi:hypothetical protein